MESFISLVSLLWFAKISIWMTLHSFEASKVKARIRMTKINK